MQNYSRPTFQKAVRAQIPIGLEEKHEGVIDLLKMKAYYFEGEMGSTKLLKKKFQKK
jgi:elongation factor G